MKRATDTRLRREVVGQLLDYAANGTAYWAKGELASAFEARCRQNEQDPDDVLSSFLHEEDPETFWTRVDANLAKGDIKLVIVADVIPPELGRILEFLHLQMEAEVLGIELRYFESDDGHTTLVPRVVGPTDQARARREARDRSPDQIALAALRREVYARAGETIAEFSDALTGNQFMRSKLDMWGFEFVIFVKSIERVDFEYICRSSKSTKARERIASLAHLQGAVNSPTHKFYLQLSVADLEGARLIAVFNDFARHFR